MDSVQQQLDQLANIARLTEWLDANLPQLGDGPLTTAFLAGGTTNVVLTIDRGQGPMVLRRPPAVPPPGAERGVLREAKVLTALNETDVPHPRCHAVCEDANVIGMPFYVMDKVEGGPAFDTMPYAYGVAFAVADGLVALANVDYRKVGLEGFGKPDNFLERQVDRWATQLASYKERYGYEGRHIEGYAEVEAWLRTHATKTSCAGIIHGDVGLQNMMFRPDPPARLAAMLDWELSTIGDPMLDLGWFCVGLADERFPDLAPAGAAIKPHLSPTKQELARYYCAGTGRDIADFDYFCLLGAFKLGCILEYKVAQAAAGVLPEDVGTLFHRSVSDIFRQGAELIRRIS
jgi:aminoglycoside phosphotransferase (APT) family kinase protein